MSKQCAMGMMLHQKQCSQVNCMLWSLHTLLGIIQFSLRYVTVLHTTWPGVEKASLSQTLWVTSSSHTLNLKILSFESTTLDALKPDFYQVMWWAIVTRSTFLYRIRMYQLFWFSLLEGIVVDRLRCLKAEFINSSDSVHYVSFSCH